MKTADSIHRQGGQATKTAATGPAGKMAAGRWPTVVASLLIPAVAGAAAHWAPKDGRVLAWGSNSVGQLNVPTSDAYKIRLQVDETPNQPPVGQNIASAIFQGATKTILFSEVREGKKFVEADTDTTFRNLMVTSGPRLGSVELTSDGSGINYTHNGTSPSFPPPAPIRSHLPWRTRTVRGQTL